MTSTSEPPILLLRDLERRYGTGENAVAALRGVTLACDVGTWTAVMGPSGCGKSTLLHCAAGLDRPTAGSVTLAGRQLAALGDDALTKLRRREIGFVFQQFNLVAALTAEQNVALPARLAKRGDALADARRALTDLGLGERLRHRPRELSGGQRQRVAIARALVTRPAVLFADEPTGALDSAAAAGLLDLLAEVVRRERQTILMVTHDPVAAARADRVVFLRDGLLVDEVPGGDVAAVARRLTSVEAAA